MINMINKIRWLLIWAKDNSIAASVVGLFCISITYSLANVLYIEPLKLEVEQQNREIQRQSGELARKSQNLEQKHKEVKQLNGWMAGIWTEEQIALLKPGVSEEQLHILEKKIKNLKNGPVSMELREDGGAEKIERNGNSFTVSIDEFWEKGTRATLRIVQLGGKETLTNALKGGDMEEIVLQDKEVYSLTVTYVKKPCVRISIEKN